MQAILWGVVALAFVSSVQAFFDFTSFANQAGGETRDAFASWAADGVELKPLVSPSALNWETGEVGKRPAKDSFSTEQVRSPHLYWSFFRQNIIILNAYKCY